jgi:deoxyhypusine synthase
MGRAGDIYFEHDGFTVFEKTVYRIFDELIEEQSRDLAFYELLAKIGETLEDHDSFLRKAAIHNIPVFSPGIMDSMLGFHIWTYNQLKSLCFNPILNLDKMADLVIRSQKVGALILGGGTPKHYALGANILREGVDAAIQITLDRHEAGSLSGAPLEEAVSWKKAQTESELVTVIGDATIIFPILVAATLERLDKKE